MPGKRSPIVTRCMVTIDPVKTEANTSQELCPTCNCPIGEFYVIKDGTAYCCEGCAVGGNGKYEGRVRLNSEDKYRRGAVY